VVLISKTKAKGSHVIAVRYSLRDEIGRGGMGIVWRADDEVLGRTVALKRVGMSPGGASPDLRRAEREARLAARLNHPHVVAVFDLATEGDEQWLVMEYVESRTLAQLVRDERRLTPDRAASLLAQAADALAAAHGAGIVHRDVKPSNILVTPAGQVKITDFGIARANADATLTSTGLVSGSPAYLAPEVAAGETATTASDVWALGATLFHALEGRPPYDAGGNVMGALYRIVHEEPPRTSRAEWLAPLLEATMAKDPEARWPMRRVLATLQQGPAAADDSTRLLTRTSSPPPPPPPPPPSTPPTVGVTDPTPTLSTQPVRPSTTPRQPDPSARRSSVTRWLVPLLAILAIVGVLALGWQLASDDGENPSGSDGGTTPSASPSPSESSTAAVPTEESMRTFVEDYLATATSDPQAAWQQLTPTFQQQSGNYGNYRDAWSTRESADVTNITADPDALTVSYDVTYTQTNGETFDDSVTLQLVPSGDSYLIAAES